MKIYLSLCCALFLVLSSQVYAKDPSFTYVEAQLISSGDIDVSDGNLSVNVDLDGFSLNGSVQLGWVILQASRFELDSDELLGGSIEDSITTVAAGLAFGGLPRTKFFALVRARRDELSLNSSFLEEEEDLVSAGIEAGVRFNVTDWLELNANIGRPSVDVGDSFGLGAQLFVTEHLGITFNYNTIDAEEDDINFSFDTTSIGVRYSF